MRFLFFTLIASLLSLAVWPWVNQFMQFMKKKYLAATDFEEETIEEEPSIAQESKKETPDESNTPQDLNS